MTNYTQDSMLSKRAWDLYRLCDPLPVTSDQLHVIWWTVSHFLTSDWLWWYFYIFLSVFDPYSVNVRTLLVNIQLKINLFRPCNFWLKLLTQLKHILFVDIINLSSRIFVDLLTSWTHHSNLAVLAKTLTNILTWILILWSWREWLQQ